MNVLDIATGAGHTALTVSPFVKEVIAIDLTPEMIACTQELAISRNIRNIRAQIMDAESLGLSPCSFDAITCRFAAHHFHNITKVLKEVSRVLKPNCQFVIEDTCAPADPELDNFINNLERLRDSTHIRSNTKAEWETMLNAAGLKVIRSRIFRKSRFIEDWIDRAGQYCYDRNKVYSALVSASFKSKLYFEINFDHNKAVSYTDDKLMIRVEKRG